MHGNNLCNNLPNAHVARDKIFEARIRVMKTWFSDTYFRTVGDTPLRLIWNKERTYTLVAYLFPSLLGICMDCPNHKLWSSIFIGRSWSDLPQCLGTVCPWLTVLERFVKSRCDCPKLTESQSGWPFCSTKSLGVFPLGVIKLPIMETSLMSSAYSQVKMFILKMIILILCLWKFQNPRFSLKWWHIVIESLVRIPYRYQQ